MKDKKLKCAVCGKFQLPEHKPFCSKHCADIDLGRWLNETYTLPSAPDQKDEEDRE